MNAPYEPSATERRAIELARIALIAKMRGAHDQAIQATQQLNDEVGSEWLEVAMSAWIDTFAVRVLGVVPGGHKQVHLHFLGLHHDACEGECGQPHGVTGAEEVRRPEVVWAGQLMAARIADDAATWGALLHALPEDELEAGRHVAAVLEVCALSLVTHGVTA
ncbi:hypothetical protein [Actinomadura nitritigenes]|uniref:hypothetical protein n=1 Tax=Actinomadura nitritigenes TaxID=134602 RepID=UPI003D8A56E8